MVLFLYSRLFLYCPGCTHLGWVTTVGVLLHVGFIVLGPLFLIYMNDIDCSVNKGQLRLFADDTNLFMSGSNVHDIMRDTEESLSGLSVWFTNMLTLNVDKTCYSIFTNKTIPDRISIIET